MKWSEFGLVEWGTVAFVVLLLALVKGPSILRALRWVRDRPPGPPPLSCFAVILVLTAVATGHAQETAQAPQSVTFESLRSSGVLTGCTLVYAVVHPAEISAAVEPVILIGSIGISRDSGSGLLAFLKIGVTDVAADHGMKPPHFAYLQTKGGTTAKSTPIVKDGDDGFRLFVGSLGVCGRTCWERCYRRDW